MGIHAVENPSRVDSERPESVRPPLSPFELAQAWAAASFVRFTGLPTNPEDNKEPRTPPKLIPGGNPQGKRGSVVRF